MTQVTVTELDLNNLSAAGLKVLKAALKYACDHADVKCHELSLDAFRRLAGIGEFSVGEAKRLLGEAQRVVVSMEVVDTESRTSQDGQFFSSPMLGLIAATSSSVVFEVDDEVLHYSILEKVFALGKR
ncbi:MAG: hypothetical protein C4294_18285 [Nitrospiraceae bacterium]